MCFSKSLMNTWYSLFDALYIINRYMVDDYKNKHTSMKRERVLHQIIGSTIIDPELGASNSTDVGTDQRTRARNKRQGGFYSNLLEFDPHKIESEREIKNGECIPIIFEETFIRTEGVDDRIIASTIDYSLLTDNKHDDRMDSGELNNGEEDNVKVVFLSHGFQGSHYDCLKIKHYFSMMRPDAIFHSCKSNEEDTTLDIDIQGCKFADEVKNVLKQYIKKKNLSTVSFIGHSLGMICIICRRINYKVSTASPI